MQPPGPSIGSHNSNKTASGKPGTLHPRAAGAPSPLPLLLGVAQNRGRAPHAALPAAFRQPQEFDPIRRPAPRVARTHDASSAALSAIAAS